MTAPTTFDAVNESVAPTYAIWLPWTANVAVANTIHWDLFNASGSGRIVRVRVIRVVPNLTTAVTGVGLQWALITTSTVGTGGTVITPKPCRGSYLPIPSVTVRQKPTGGAGTGPAPDTWLGFNSSSEETQAVGPLVDKINLLNFPTGVQDITLMEGQGLKGVQVTSSSIGQTGFFVLIQVE